MTTLEVPDQFATVRTNPVTGRPDVLGVVGRGYTPIQNEEHAALLDALVDESGAHFETAGSLRGGRQVFLTMKLPTTMQIGGVDPVDLYLIAFNSHDGTSALPAAGVPGPGGVREHPGGGDRPGPGRRSRSGTPPARAATSSRPGRRSG